MSKPKVMLTVDVEALPMRAESDHINTLIYGRKDGKEYGIGRMMDIADRHNIKMTFFVDFAECELYGDEILEVGRYIVSRGHDMQVHCHCDWLEKKIGRPSFVNARDNYYLWYKNDEDSKIIADYVTDKYIECTGKMPLAFRGGEYRFGTAMLKALKEKEYVADLSYNCIRPEALPENKQFEYENGLLEFPVGILHNKKPLNFNNRPLVPKSRADFDNIISEYKTLFNDYFNYYGNDAIASMMMHSWSFMHTEERTNKTWYFDMPNEVMVGFFDYFIESMKEYVDFVSVTEAINSVDRNDLKKVDFNAVFNRKAEERINKLLEMCDLIHEKAGNRNFIVWGTSAVEDELFRTVNFHKEFQMQHYISQDADVKPIWRGKPVYKFDDVELTPEKDFVLVLANPQHTDIRESLRNSGFKDTEDYFDFRKEVLKLDNKAESDKGFDKNSDVYRNKMLELCDLVNKNIGNRNFIVWGTGAIEDDVFHAVNYHNEFQVLYYISQDADKKPVWRDKPVRKFDDVELSPEKDYVFLFANPLHNDIRESLQNLGFKETVDYIDVQKELLNACASEYACSVCGGKTFEAFNANILRRCSTCGSVERTRTILNLFNGNVNIDFSSAKILHVSPSMPEKKIFKKYDAAVTTIDIRPELKTDIVGDICNMPEVTSETYDVVFANCVLNHVYDDKMALSEIKRVLCSGGMALLWVLDSGTLRNYYDAEPTSWYGKENYEKYKIGTFRHYGEVDFTELLRNYFSDVRCFEKYDEVTDISCKWYRCIK